MASCKAKAPEVAIRFLLVALAALTLFPFWYVLVQSFSDPVFGAKAWIVPVKFFAMNYKVVFLTRGIGTAYFNTILRVVTGVPIYLLVTGMTAFVFSRKEFRGKKWLIWAYLIVMYFDGGAITFFVWMRQIHLYNNWLIYILPGCYGMWAMIVMKTAFREVPESLVESAMMDGAGYFRIFLGIILPLSMPMIATMGLFAAVTYWNDWYYGTLLIEDQKKWTLQTFLQMAVLKGQVQVGFQHSPVKGMGIMNLGERAWNPDEFEKLMKLNSLSMESAYIMISTLPILLVYPFVQRFFIKGVLIGAIKE